MVEEAPKSFYANIAASDMFVPVDMRIELGLGIIGVNDVDVVEAQELVDLRDGLLESGSGGEVIAGGKAVAGIEAEADF